MLIIERKTSYAWRTQARMVNASLLGQNPSEYVNNVNLSVLELGKVFLYPNGVEFARNNREFFSIMSDI